MPYKDPMRQRAAQKRHDAKRGKTVERLAQDVQNAGDLPDPPSREVLLKALGVQALEGNVPAIRLLLEEYRRDASEQDTAEDPFAEFDELAPRRGRASA